MTRRRPYNTLGRRILAVLELGPRKRTVLVGLAGNEQRLKPVLARLRAAGRIVLRGSKRGARYALAPST